MQVPRSGPACRRCLTVLVLGSCGLVLVRAFALEPFQVPTSSMAPALLGHHRLCTCPRCGLAFPVGRHPGDHDGLGSPGCYRKAACPSCGQHPVPVAALPESCGDHVLVEKTAFVLRQPRRWEVVVLRLLGAFFIKRLVGLPGEEVLLHDGDVYIDGRLARKSFAQARAMCLLVFDHDHLPGADGWQARWECEPAAPTHGRVLELDGCTRPCTLTYRHFLLDEGKAEPLGDEYAYNSGAHGGVEAVHDFLFEANIEVMAGQGTLALRLCDGLDWTEVELPVGPTAGAVCARAWPADAAGAARELPAPSAGSALRAGRSYHVNMAFVDRRLSLAVDGEQRLSVDLPEPPGTRPGVVAPVRLRADGVRVEVRNFRLYRDIHYSQRGTWAVHGRPVRSGADQYFVLGDNSPDSEDSRFWAVHGELPTAGLVGKPVLVHLPSRRRALTGPGGVAWQGDLPDWSRIRWLR